MTMIPYASVPRSWMSSQTITVNPAAGPLTCNGQPDYHATTRPAMIPVTIPDPGGAPDATVMPMQSGKATRKTTTEGSRSCRSSDQGA